MRLFNDGERMYVGFHDTMGADLTCLWIMTRDKRGLVGVGAPFRKGQNMSDHVQWRFFPGKDFVFSVNLTRTCIPYSIIFHD